MRLSALLLPVLHDANTQKEQEWDAGADDISYRQQIFLQPMTTLISHGVFSDEIS